MSNNRDSKKSRMKAVVIALLFIGTALIVPVSVTATNPQKNFYTYDSEGPFQLDRSYYLIDPDPASRDAVDNADAGYKRDAGLDQARALPLFPGEAIDDTPGRGRTGKLSSSDKNDWYAFSVCQGQQIVFSVIPLLGFDINISLWTKAGVRVANSNNSGSTPETISYVATYTGKWSVCLQYVSGTGSAKYNFSVVLNGQNDANSGSDAPNIRTSALLVTPGLYYGYVDKDDPYDWYKIQATTGQGIAVSLMMTGTTYLTDFDLQLYNPSGTLVYEANKYLDDSFNYPADVTGQWSIRVDIFPGWVDCPAPTEWNYYSYGSGAYNLSITLQISGVAPPGPIPQPDITPVAKTFKITNDPDSTKDDFAYLAAVPACNYLDGGQRYLAPIIYTGDTTPTAYYDDSTSFGTVDDTTQYLLDDWNAYLDTHNKTAENFTVPADPIQAAATIATNNWATSQTAVVAVDGSSFNDTTKSVVKKTKTLKRQAEVSIVPGDSEKIISIGGVFAYPMFLGPKWCAVNVTMYGTGGATPTFDAIVPLFMTQQYDDWPCPSDGEGTKYDIYHPVNKMGFWAAGADVKSELWNFKITKYAGDRYHFRVSANDAVINAKVTTDDPSDLLIFLIDPQGNIRSPIIPAWNGPVNPIHVWNGLENPPDNPWRCWNPAPHTEFSAEVLHPEKGYWTAIVVPRNANGSNVKYTVNVDLRTINKDRADATISAANAAVIASLNHLPLLYVTKNSVPAATASAFSTLGVTKTIFVERGKIGDGVRSSLPTVQKDLQTMQEIVDEIKSYPASENYVTATSLKTGDGYFAPAAMLAAYHGSPVIRVEEAPNGDPAGVAERIEAWQRWGGDYYHGSRANGHLPKATALVEQNKLKIYLTLVKFLLGSNVTLPPFGLDAKRYWNEECFTKFHDYIESLGLDEDGPESYAIVAPRNDINMELHSVLMGNNSNAGAIIGITPSHSNDFVVRNILYPALIFVNPGRDVTTTQMMNFPDGTGFKLNDGVTYPAYSSRVVKDAFSSHLRTYEGHCFWRAHLQRMNDGASAFYYSGHGTGGSGMSSMYEKTDHSVYPEQVWWDAWRGYMYDAWKTPRDGGWTWFNPEPPELYDIVHYKWIDQNFENLRSNAIFYMSCTTGDGDGPLVYLDHGAVCWYGNANTGLCPEADLADDNFFVDILINGQPIGISFANQIWLHYRDFTTGDNTSMYGPSSMQVDSIQVIYGDPALIVYSPEWTSPVPIDA